MLSARKRRASGEHLEVAASKNKKFQPEEVYRRLSLDSDHKLLSNSATQLANPKTTPKLVSHDYLSKTTKMASKAHRLSWKYSDEPNETYLMSASNAILPSPTQKHPKLGVMARRLSRKSFSKLDESDSTSTTKDMPPSTPKTYLSSASNEILPSPIQKHPKLGEMDRRFSRKSFSKLGESDSTSTTKDMPPSTQKKSKMAAFARLLSRKSWSESCNNDSVPASKGIRLPTQQFGVSLQFIIQNNTNVVDCIPPIIRQCVDYLSQTAALETEGIFRRSASVRVIKEMVQLCNRGEAISFGDDPHNAAVLLKYFLKDLEEPILTFDLYEEILNFPSLSKSEKSRRAKILILKKIPGENYKLLKFIFQFLWKVQERSCLNKMTIGNLAIVFGPSISWPCEGYMSLEATAPICTFTEYILAHQKSIFIS